MTKKIRVTDVFGSPLYGAYVYHEGEVSATDKNGYVTITVDDPYSLIKITHVSGVPVEIPFVDLPKFLVLEPESLDTVVINGSKKKNESYMVDSSRSGHSSTNTNGRKTRKKNNIVRMKLIYQNKVPAAYREPFIEKVISISKSLGINPNWLMQIMYWESARTFSPSVQNPNTLATGLIQFMPDTAEWLGTTIYDLKNMTALRQLDFVEEYYRRYRSRLNSYIDLYLTTFYPAAVGKPRDYVLGGTYAMQYKIAAANPSFDNNGDYKITKGEIEDDMLAKVPSEWLGEFVKKKEKPHC